MSLLADLNARYTDTAFRFERLRPSPDFDPKALRSIHDDPYLRRVAQHVLAGKRRERALIVEQSLTRAMLELLTPYCANVAVGEKVVVVTSGEFVGRDGDDFWMFDQDTDHAQAVVMRYDPEGRVADRKHIAGQPAALRPLHDRAVAAWAAGVPLSEFLAHAHGVRCAG